jgi:hypothetical protein
MLSLADLVSAGFEPCAEWVFNRAGNPHLKGEIPKRPGVYLFVVGDAVRYVGKADKTVHHRMGHYVRGIRRLKKRRDVHDGIEEELAKDQGVIVYAFCEFEPRFAAWKGMPIDRLTGLEGGLIENLKPKWNTFNAAGRARRARTAGELAAVP